MRFSLPDISWDCCKRTKKKSDVDDSNVDAVIARNLWKNHRILPPNSKNKQNWDLFIVRMLRGRTGHSLRTQQNKAGKPPGPDADSRGGELARLSPAGARPGGAPTLRHPPTQGQAASRCIAI